MESGGDVGNAAEVAEISNKKNPKKRNILKPKQMSLDIVWAHFYGSGVTLEGGR